MAASKDPKEQAKNQKLSIFKVNLLVHKGDPVKIHILLLKWLLSSGRYIAIFVEIIVIVAVVMRYKLDGELSELKNNINERAAYIKTLSSDEALIKQTQFKLSTIKQMRRDNPDFAAILLDIAQQTPTRINLTNIAFSKPSPAAGFGLSISGQTPSNVELSVFIKSLQKDPLFTDISLSNISFEGETVFTIIGNLAPQGGKNS